MPSGGHVKSSLPQTDVPIGGGPRALYLPVGCYTQTPHPRVCCTPTFAAAAFVWGGTHTLYSVPLTMSTHLPHLYTLVGLEQDGYLRSVARECSPCDFCPP